jgi:pyruvate,water dikinase
MTHSTILPLDSPGATLAVAGGKGANLAQLARAGFPVPGGFIVITDAYRRYVASNGLDGVIVHELARRDLTDPDDLEAASSVIRAAFSAASLGAGPEAGGAPEGLADLVQAICDAYRSLGDGDPPVAVRSSATAEDLPDQSFAGQQDTFLNVVGEEALLEAVVNCWSSLWTARAIGYRARNGIPRDEAALAVVVQKMVAAEASGVAFTADPLTGARNRVVIDATLGLGEALVSGKVEPDHYEVEGDPPRVSDLRLGAKAVVIAPAPGGGVVESHPSAAAIQALPDEQIVALAALARAAEAHYGAPQDIEWTWAGGRLALLQSRPITTLYPTPEGMPAEPLRVLASFGALQGMLDPITPLGRDMIRLLVSGAAGAFGYQGPEPPPAFRVAGERVFVDITGALRTPRTRRIAQAVLPEIEPATGQAVTALLDDPRLAADRPNPGFLGALARFAIIPPRLARSLASPGTARRRAQETIERVLAEETARLAGAETLTQLLEALDGAVRRAFPTLFKALLPAFVPGIGSFYRLLALAERLPGGETLALQVARGMPHNVTTEMDLALWAAARQVQAYPAAAQQLAETDAHELAGAYLRPAGASPLATALRTALDGFLARYGARGVAEIDLGRIRWREDPTPVIRSLASYAQITDPELAPDAVFARGAGAAAAAVESLSAQARTLPHGRIRAWQVRFFARRARALAGLRETPKFTIIRVMGAAREAFLRFGRELAAAGVLELPEDIFFLHWEELQALGAAPEGGPCEGEPERRSAGGVAAVPPRAEDPWWRRLVAERRAIYGRELRRKQVPRLLLSDGRAIYAGIAGMDGGGVLTGSPVSPGAAEGPVHIVLDPHGSQLAPGEILVCRGTDPAWTPLFLSAGGLVMEVGGLMTHGAVVAREYGIPAVVGVDRATTRLANGQQVRVDGSAGTVTRLEGQAAG